MPDISGVIIFLVYFSTRLISISTLEAAIQEPKISGSPPAMPAEMMGPMNEKLVP